MTGVSAVVDALQVDVVGWLIARMHTALDGVGVDDETPGDLDNEVPFLRVLRFGGGNDNHLLDYPTIALHGWEKTQGAADRLVASAQAAVRALRGQVVDNTVITRTRTLSGPSYALTDNQNLRHSVGLMEIRIRLDR